MDSKISILILVFQAFSSLNSQPMNCSIFLKPDTTLAYIVELHETPFGKQGKAPLIFSALQTVHTRSSKHRLTMSVQNKSLQWHHQSSFSDSLTHPYYLLKEELLQQGQIFFDTNQLATASLFSHFFLPLPHRPVQLNETWEFNEILKTTGIRESIVQFSGHCLLYSIDKQQNDCIATLIVNIITESLGQFNYQDFYQIDNQTFSINAVITRIIKFNLNKGRIEKSISEQKHTFHITQGKTSRNFTINSKLICRLKPAN